ncbi:BMP family ABC transporter substrate-binding protein [Planotetraspora thailandica]|uniref:BMP family ABC transporter substrate-binding protein n=1 Tax=Planotetraspora thailandica TaxID=487172 RepID=A0A8J3XSG1_9ACTN|nr:BMP family ABC transporter substrate-binding protein [Planotetraspora thailandica]GII53182.1 BMP family ABC transporter substrate-binding protein [Planotetraspora thailandica]
MRSIAALVAGVLMASAAGCGTTAAHTAHASVDVSSMKVGLAYDIGGRGDQSFNDAAAAGLDDAKRNLGLRQVKELEATPGEGDQQKADRLRVLADAGYSPIIAVGYAYSDAMKKVAPDFPHTSFAIVDDDAARGRNVTNLLFAEEQGSFLVGASAALKSRTGRVGFVGGVQSPLIEKFQAGFTQGVKYVNPRASIEVKYLTQPPDITGFDDPAKARTAAQGMYDAGADVVYQAAGGSGAGVFEAAKDHEAWAIGVDSDQALTADPEVRPNILTSMMKKVNVAVYDYLAGIADGTMRAGPTVYDLRLGGVDYSTTGGHLRDIDSRLEELKQQIIVGKIRVASH